MTRALKAATMALAAVGCAAHVRPDYSLQPVPAVMYVSHAVVQQWALWYREFETEFIGCLYGSRVADTLTVEELRPARMAPSRSKTREASGSCRADGLVGQVHNHRAPEAESFAGCFVSTVDSLTFAKSKDAVALTVCGTDKLLVLARDWRPFVIRYDGESGELLALSAERVACFPHDVRPAYRCEEER